MQERKRENFWLNIGFNIAAPSILLVKGGDIFRKLGADFEGVDVAVFVLALAFPLEEFGQCVYSGLLNLHNLSECLVFRHCPCLLITMQIYEENMGKPNFSRYKNIKNQQIMCIGEPIPHTPSVGLSAA